MQRKVLKLITKKKIANKFYNNKKGITLIALVITIALNCSFVAMELIMK